MFYEIRLYILFQQINDTYNYNPLCMRSFTSICFTIGYDVSVLVKYRWMSWIVSGPL